MPDQKKKLVKVPDLGVVAFPDTMPDDQVASAIKNHLAKPAQGTTFQPLPNTSGEGLYKMVFPGQGLIAIPFSKVMDVAGSGGLMLQSEAERYAKDKNWEIYQRQLREGKRGTSQYQELANMPMPEIIPDDPSKWQNLQSFVQKITKPTPTKESPGIGTAATNIAKTTGGYMFGVVALPGQLVSSLRKELNPIPQIGEQGSEEFGSMRPDVMSKMVGEDIGITAKTDPKLALEKAIGFIASSYVTEGLISGGKALIKSTPILPEEIPTRANTRAIHSNSSGEVRMGTDNVPTIWMRPQAWKEYLRVAHPEEGHPENIGGENVATDDAFRNLYTDKGLSGHSSWLDTQELFRKAHQSSPRGTAVLAEKAGSLQNAVKVLREEKIHSWQRSLAQNKNITSSLPAKVFDGLFNDVPRAMREHLSADYEDASKPMFVSESAARFIANDLHGTTPAEAVQFLDKYFTAIVDEHGPNALAELEHTRGLATHLKEIIDEEHRSADTTATPGDVRGMAEGRQGRPAPAIQPTPAAEPAFSREQTVTPQFKNWFGDSKVVDEEGKPKVVYHGTRNDFSEFKMFGGLPHGMYFTDNPEYASSYTLANMQEMGANLKPSYLSIKHPASYEKFVSELRNDNLGRADAIKRLQAQGYDGAIVTQAEEWQIKDLPDLHNTHVYIAFDPTQIKSAIGNRGTFDPESANILFSRIRKEVEGRDPDKGTSFLFVSPSTFNLELPQVEMRFGGRIHQMFNTLSGDLAKSLGVESHVNNSIGHWLGGAENSVVHEFPPGTDPDVIDYIGAIEGKLGNQNAYGKFTAEAGGPDRMYAFWVPGEIKPEKIASVLAKHGIENDTMEKVAGGHRILVLSQGESLMQSVVKASEELGVGNLEEHNGRAEFPGDYTDRAAASREFQRTIDSLEQKHPDWKRTREGFESRDDFGTLHRLIRNTKEPFREVTHGSTRPELTEISPEKFGTGPQKSAEAKRAAAWPEYWEPRSFFQVKGTRGEPFYVKLQYQYRSILNSENIYPIVDDPDNLKSLIPSKLVDPSGRVTAFEKIIKQSGYDGYYTPDGVVQVFKGTPAEAILKDEGMFSRRPRTWKDVKRFLTKDELARHDTPEKQQKIVDAVNAMPDAEEWDAAVKAGASGRLWFERSSRAFDALMQSQPDMFEPKDKNKFLNFVAALSPVQPVRQNLLMAINLWDKWNSAGRPVDVEWNDEKNFSGVKNKNAILFRILKGRGNTVGVDLPARLYNAIRALQDQPMSGPKVRSFAPNLGRDVERSTNDTWMAVFANVDPSAINKPHLYDAVSAMVREAGRKNGIPTRQAQAAAWSFIKSLAEVSGWGNDRWRPPEEIVRKGLLTPELLNAHAADFADMLKNDEEIRARIKDIGGNLDALDAKLGKYVPERPAGEQEPASAVLTRLLGAARRLEAARGDARTQAHLAAKADQPSLFAAEFNPEKMEGAFSRSQAPTWYLKSERIADDKMKGPMPADDLLKMLLSNGVKPEEMKWTGLDEFLSGKGKEKVTPEELRSYIAANNLQVKEVMHGAGMEDPKIIKPNDLELTIDTHDYSAANPVTGKITRVGKGTVSSPEEARAYLARYFTNENITDAHMSVSVPKFGKYVLPGGQNYREMLLTLPKEPKAEDLLRSENRMQEIRGQLKTIRDKYDPLVSQYQQSGQWDLMQKTHRQQVDESEALSQELRSLQERRVLGTGEQFQSSHWDEPNVVGHVRFNDRTGPNGEKLLHLEELQSDWHQKGRQQGYADSGDQIRTRSDAERRGYSVYRAMSNQGTEAYFANGPEIPRGLVPNIGFDTEAEAWSNLLPRLQEYKWNEHKVPDAPFKKTWPELLMKRMIRYASENGYDGISWTPGEEQAARYDLSKQVDKIVVIPTEEGSRAVRIHTPTAGESIKFMVDKDGIVTPAFSSGNEFAGKNISDVVGKDVAEKIMTAPKETALTGVDLKVGGEGMKGFYDKIVPEVANKLGKQFGAKVQSTKIQLGSMFDEPSEEEYRSQKYKERGGEKSVPYFPITDSMRKAVMEEGQPLFHREQPVNTYFSGDNFKTRRTTGHNMLDPESLMTGEELEKGFTYENSHRVFRNQAHYDATVSGDVPSHLVPTLSPRQFNVTKGLSEAEKAELFTLDDKIWKNTATPEEQKRYYELSDRDTAKRYGLALTPQQKSDLDQFRNTFLLIQHLKAEAETRNPESGQPTK